MKLKYNLIVFILSILVCNCKKFVQLSPPTTELVTASVFSDNVAATAAQIAIYSRMATNNESGLMAIYTGLLGDELVNYSNLNGYIQFYNNTLSASAAPGPWKRAYNYIYQANAVLLGVVNNQTLSPAVVQQLTGEARFLRAFWYFYLTNLYGDVPLTTITNYASNAQLIRSAKSGIYQQIISDLTQAQQELNSGYVDASDTTIVTDDRSRPTKWAATALLARVYLYLGENKEAENEADSVIGNSSQYSLCTDLNNVFLVSSPEAIWQLAIPLPTTVNTYDGFDFILTSAPKSTTNCCGLSAILMKSFEIGDNRRINWIDSFVTKTTPVVTYYYPYKYKVRTGTTVTEDVMVLRLAEQFLIRAEARVNQGNIDGAIDDLNSIRNRAGLNNYGGSKDATSVTQAIWHERQVELFTEWGNRWLDLIRTNSVDTVMGAPGNVTQFKSKGTNQWNQNDELFPIPQSEITIDSKLTQNPGY